MLAIIALVVGPIDYAANGIAGLGFGLVAGLGFGLGFGLVAGLVAGLGFGLGAGLSAGLGFGLVGGLSVGLVVGLSAGLSAGLVAGLSAGLVVGLGAGLVGGLSVGLVAGLSAGLGAGLGILLRQGLQEGFTDFPKIWDYLRLMGRPLLGYTLGYAAIVVWFSSVYASLYALNLHACRVQHQVIPCDAAFSGISTPHFGDFLFFAITIFPPIGAYSDLKPVAPWAQGVVAGELIVGVGYTTVVFAAILAYRTPAFDKLRRWNTQKAIARHMEFMKADLKSELYNAQKQTHTDLNNLDERMKRIEDQLKELTKQHSSASAQGATRRTRRHTWRRK